MPPFVRFTQTEFLKKCDSADFDLNQDLDGLYKQYCESLMSSGICQRVPEKKRMNCDKDITSSPNSATILGYCALGIMDIGLDFIKLMAHLGKGILHFITNPIESTDKAIDNTTSEYTDFSNYISTEYQRELREINAGNPPTQKQDIQAKNAVLGVMLKNLWENIEIFLGDQKIDFGCLKPKERAKQICELVGYMALVTTAAVFTGGAGAPTLSTAMASRLNSAGKILKDTNRSLISWFMKPAQKIKKRKKDKDSDDDKNDPGSGGSSGSNAQKEKPSRTDPSKKDNSSKKPLAQKDSPESSQNLDREKSKSVAKTVIGEKGAKELAKGWKTDAPPPPWKGLLKPAGLAGVGAMALLGKGAVADENSQSAPPDDINAEEDPEEETQSAADEEENPDPSSQSTSPERSDDDEYEDDSSSQISINGPKDCIQTLQDGEKLNSHQQTVCSYYEKIAQLRQETKRQEAINQQLQKEIWNQVKSNHHGPNFFTDPNFKALMTNLSISPESAIGQNIEVIQDVSRLKHYLSTYPPQIAHQTDQEVQNLYQAINHLLHTSQTGRPDPNDYLQVYRQIEEIQNSAISL